ncbi:uncharacterized protein [uncultured Mediterranean phage uvMED]|nr:uncharacterized protein [uncultured Mediterranean phage uvMED]BAR21605.1 uncharacterized protein [uncultured Mediterranean phage uvMED]BAR21617.1 uncharacterized protein [uncultured Mediterranean phage uvMED]BAR21630.1 uncharacterized protein [uncultured Mediterranean phage uvMED]BAR21687.1 uncharacterized protein [uncultured Mediterranean phage uvMED]
MSQLKVNSIIPTAGVATGQGGGIIQVIKGEQRSSVSFASIATGSTSGDVLTCNITPTSNTSKILIQAMLNVSISSTANTIYGKIFRDGSIIDGSINQDSNGSRNEIHSSTLVRYDWQLESLPFLYIDSPSSTSQLTYQLRLSHSSGGTQTLYLNQAYQNTNNSAYGVSASFLHLMEVSA